MFSKLLIPHCPYYIHLAVLNSYCNKNTIVYLGKGIGLLTLQGLHLLLKIRMKVGKTPYSLWVVPQDHGSNAARERAQGTKAGQQFERLYMCNVYVMH